VDGEWVQRLAPLGLPPRSRATTAAEAACFPAVQLFIERAAATMGGFELGDADAPAVVEICRRLDGNALAIELAAARADAFSPHELAVLLDDGFRVLTQGRRTALPRHRTLRATLDWSHALLSDAERVLLRRLSLFNGGFGLAAAAEIAAGSEIGGPEVSDLLASLVTKSLVLAEGGDAEVKYRLLDTTRAYAREKLAEAGELEPLARRHAEGLRRVFERAEAEWETRPTGEWLAAYAGRVDDLRAALGWAFSASGDAALGVALTVAAVPLWFQLSLVDECLGWVERALAPPRRRQRGMRAGACSSMRRSAGRRCMRPAGWKGAPQRGGLPSGSRRSSVMPITSCARSGRSGPTGRITGSSGRLWHWRAGSAHLPTAKATPATASLATG
jgi:predicted ATPase